LVEIQPIVLGGVPVLKITHPGRGWGKEERQDVEVELPRTFEVGVLIPLKDHFFLLIQEETHP